MNGHPDQDSQLGKVLGIVVGVVLFGAVALYVAVLTGPWTDCGVGAYEAFKADRANPNASTDYVVTQCR